MRIYLQSEASECGLACIAMILDHYERHTSLVELRKQFSISSKGATLLSLTRYAAAVDLSSRPLRLDLDELGSLQLPCVLHWDLDHFVVLKRVKRKMSGALIFTVLDPAVGERRLLLREVSKHFTGVAIEFSPTAKFKKVAPVAAVKFSELTGPIKGLRLALAQVISLAIALEVFAIALPLFNQFVIDEVIQSGDIDLLKILVFGFSIVIATQMCISLARGWIMMRWGMEIGLQWSQRVFSHLLGLRISYFEKRHLGDVVSRFGSISAIQSTLTGVFAESMLDGFMACIALMLMCVYSLKLTGVVVGSVICYALLRWAYYGPLRSATAERVILSAREASHFLETLRAITPLKLYGREQQRRERWQNLQMDVQNRDIKTQKLSITARIAHSTIFSIQGLSIFYIGAHLIISAEMTVGMLMAFSSYGASFSGRAFSLIDMVINYKMVSLHAERLADIVHGEADRAGDCSGPLPKFEHSIVFRGVKFRYSDSEAWVLKGVDLTIHKGECIAITGPSGCGKTTLCKILLGLLEPTEGDIYIDGIPLSTIGISSYRRIVGTVMQDDVLLSGSIYDNITFFDEISNSGLVEEAAKSAAIHAEICAMPMAYQTLVGDMGSSLSGGQRQRILLARAIYRSPMVVCLDEATSHLDLANEEIVMSGLMNNEATCIMVAHRPSTIDRADRVVAMASGSVDSTRSATGARSA